MCTPMALMAASMAISTVSGVASYQQGKASAAAQTAAIEDGYTKEQAATLRQYEENNAATQEQQGQRYTEHLLEEGRLKAIGAESGFIVNDGSRIFQEEQNKASYDMATIEANRMRANAQANAQGVARQSQANAQLSGVRSPSALGTGLQIAGQGVALWAQATKPTDNKNGK